MSVLDDPTLAPMRKDTMEYIFTASGKKFFFDRPDTIHITDIAHALSNVCRWTGHVREFYSVAQHSVLVSEYLAANGSSALALRGLLHDAAEAYIGDINKPLKTLIKALIDPIEDRIERAVFKRYGLSEEMSDNEKKSIKAADMAVAIAESEQLLGQTTVAHYFGVRAAKIKIDPLDPSDAKAQFLSKFKELM